MPENLPQLYIRHMKNMGHGIMFVRDYSFGREFPLLREPLIQLAEMHAFHVDGVKIWRNDTAPPAQKFLIAHRGVGPRPGDEPVCEIQYIPQN